MKSKHTLCIALLIVGAQFFSTATAKLPEPTPTPDCNHVMMKNGKVAEIIGFPFCATTQQIFSSCKVPKIIAEDRGESKQFPGGKRWHGKCWKKPKK